MTLTKTPVELIQRYQVDPSSLSPLESAEVWRFLDGYVARQERLYFGANEREGDPHIDRVIALYKMLRERKVPTLEIIDGYKACKVNGEYPHPNNVLTYFRLTLCHLETMLRFKRYYGVDLTYFGYSFDINMARVQRFSKVMEAHRKSGYKATLLETYEKVTQTVKKLETKKLWYETTRLYYYWATQPLSLSSRLNDEEYLEKIW